MPLTSFCSPCRNGTYSSGGSRKCLECSENQFSTRGSSACQPCNPETEFSPKGYARCLRRHVCTARDYYEVRNAANCNKNNIFLNFSVPFPRLVRRAMRKTKPRQYTSGWIRRFAFRDSDCPRLGRSTPVCRAIPVWVRRLEAPPASSVPWTTSPRPAATAKSARRTQRLITATWWSAGPRCPPWWAPPADSKMVRTFKQDKVLLRYIS